jgi:hypothetical protein
VPWHFLPSFRQPGPAQAVGERRAMLQAADREPVGQSGEAQRWIELAQVGHRLLRLVLAADQRLARREDAGLPAPLCASELEVASRGGRPKVPAKVRSLVRQMSVKNPLWGAPRVHGELLKLGIEVAQSTVAKYMAKRRPRSARRGRRSCAIMWPVLARLSI